MRARSQPRSASFSPASQERLSVWVWWASRSPPPLDRRLLEGFVGAPGGGAVPAFAPPPFFPVG
jgi:hypothetical protein